MLFRIFNVSVGAMLLLNSFLSSLRNLRAGNRRGLSNLISEALLASLTVILGIVVLTVSAGWFNTATADATKDTNENILIINTSNMLKIEHVNYTLEEQRVIVRNIAKVPVVVTRLELRRENGALAGEIPDSAFFSKLATLEKGDTAEFDIPLCTSCNYNEELTLMIWFVAAALFDEENPLNSADEMMFVETKFLNPVGEVVERCPLPDSDWLLIDVVDPVTFTDSGAILPPPWNVVRIRAPVASSSTTTSLHVTVSGSSQGSGHASKLVPSSQLISVEGGFSGITPPMEITVAASGYEVLQRTWYLDMLDDKIHVSGVTLSWTGVDRILTGIAIQLGVAVPGEYRVSVQLYDCKGKLLGTFSKDVSIPEGIDATTVMISVEEGISLKEVYGIKTLLSGV